MQNPGEPDPFFTQDQLIALAQQAAVTADLDPSLVCALVEQESAWKPTAVRFEPAFKIRYVDPLNLAEPEATNRSTSWGLMQVMGEVAREFGYADDIPALLVPATGLEWGCKVLAHKIAVNGGNIHDALQAWNGGGNPNYASEVLARVPKYQTP